ncbi:hypothetical protein KEM09_21730, partial [Carboxylicivirga mesophila]
IQNSPLFFHNFRLKLTIYKRSESEILRRTQVIRDPAICYCSHAQIITKLQNTAVAMRKPLQVCKTLL